MLPVRVGLLIMPDVVAMKKASPTHVQAGKADIESVRQQRSIGKIFGEAPVDAPIVIVQGKLPALEQVLDSDMKRKARRYDSQFLQNRLQLIEWNRGDHGPGPRGGWREARRQRMRRRSCIVIAGRGEFGRC